MDFLMPFIIVIYLLSAIVTAVMKAMSASKQQQQKQMAKSPQQENLRQVHLEQSSSRYKIELQKYLPIVSKKIKLNQYQLEKASKSLTRSAMTKNLKKIAAWPMRCAEF